MVGLSNNRGAHAIRAALDNHSQSTCLFATGPSITNWLFRELASERSIIRRSSGFQVLARSLDRSVEPRLSRSDAVAGGSVARAMVR